MGISIQQQFCNYGIGSTMLGIAIDQTRKNGFEQLELGVFSDNKTTYTEFKNLMNDYCNNNLDGISKAEAKDKIHEISLQIFGLGLY